MAVVTNICIVVEMFKIIEENTGIDIFLIIANDQFVHMIFILPLALFALQEATQTWGH